MKHAGQCQAPGNSSSIQPWSCMPYRMWNACSTTNKLVFNKCSIKITQQIQSASQNTHTHTHTRLTALFPGLPRWASTRKGKSIWILLKHETVSGSGISWAHVQVCTSLQADNHASTSPLSFYRPDALPVTQPTASKHCQSEDTEYTRTGNETVANGYTTHHPIGESTVG